MRIVVLGGSGVIGSEAVKDLEKSNEVSKVIVADNDEEKAKQLTAELGSRKVQFQWIDLNDRGNLLKLIKGIDVLLNTAGPFFQHGTKVIEAAIEAKVNYVDIGDDYDVAREAFKLDQRAKDAGIIILIGMGASPGLANVLAAYGANKLSRVNEIRINWLHPCGVEGKVVYQHIYHMMTGKVPQYLDCREVELEAGTGEEAVEFPEPLGKCQVCYVGHPEPVTLPRYIKGVKVVTCKGGLFPRTMQQALNLFVRAGLARLEPVKVEGISINARDFLIASQAFEILVAKLPQSEKKIPGGRRYEVKGEKDGKLTNYIYIPKASVLSPVVSGTSSSIAARMIGRGNVKEKGVTAPEGCIDPKPYLSELLRKGIMEITEIMEIEGEKQQKNLIKY